MPPRIIECEPNDSAKHLVAEVGLCERRSAIILAGSAQFKDRAHEETSRSILEVVFETTKHRERLCVLDGGIDTGIMAMAADAREKAKSSVPLIGVAPKGVLTAEPGAPTLQQAHSHLFVVRGETWGAETQLLIDLAKEIGKADTCLILLGGGENATIEVVTAMKGGITVYAVEGTGGIADELAQRRGPTTKAAHLIEEEWLRTMIEVVEEGSELGAAVSERR